MDIKMNFIDQLQDKLASMKNSTMNSSKTKWSKNSSSSVMTTPQANDTTDLETSNDQTRLNEQTKTGHSETESQLLANYNFMDNNKMTNGDETVLTEEQALRELNNSRSKWGISSGGNNETSHINKKKSRSFDKVIKVFCLKSVFCSPKILPKNYYLFLVIFLLICNIFKI